jgi:hypothetical protein
VKPKQTLVVVLAAGIPAVAALWLISWISATNKIFLIEC